MAETPSTVTERLSGRVKWFNNKAGYGFITVSTDGEFSGQDIFVHHTSLVVENQQYKYLVQGEYVDLQLSPIEGGVHKFQASLVKGINNGLLMCETRREFRANKAEGSTSTSRHRGNGIRSTSSSSDVTTGVEASTPKVAESKPKSAKVRGSGPRDGAEWVDVKKDSAPPRRGRPPKTTSAST